jgi:hypothetical protein
MMAENERIRGLVDAVWETLKWADDKDLEQAYTEVRGYDINPTSAWVLFRWDKSYRDQLAQGVVLGTYEDAKEAKRVVVLRDKADAYNACELHDEDYDKRYEWDIEKVEIL